MRAGTFCPEPPATVPGGVQKNVAHSGHSGTASSAARFVFTCSTAKQSSRTSSLPRPPDPICSVSARARATPCSACRMNSSLNHGPANQSAIRTCEENPSGAFRNNNKADIKETRFHGDIIQGCPATQAHLLVYAIEVLR